MEELEELRRELARLSDEYIYYTAPLSWALAEAGVEPTQEHIDWMNQNRARCSALASRIAQLEAQGPQGRAEGGTGARA